MMIDDYFKEMKCNRCKSKVSSFSYGWNGGLCNNCNTRRAFIFGFSFLFVALAISFPLVLVQYNYQLDKCSNLVLSESSYDFTNTVEVNARYNERCYFLNNHPLALPYLFGAGIFYAFAFGVIGFMIGYMSKPLGYRSKQ